MTPHPAAPVSPSGRCPGRLVVVGQGYVGLPLALRAVEVGYDVVGFDLDATGSSAWPTADSYVEDITDGRLAAALATGRYLPTDDRGRLAGFDLAVIDVPTPLHDGSPNLPTSRTPPPPSPSTSGRGPRWSSSRRATREPPRSWWSPPRGRLRPGGGRDFHARVQPRAHRPRQRHVAAQNTPKVVSGVDDASLAVVEEFYGRIVDRTVAVSGTREAELTKLLENTFRHVNIALVNELAMFAADLDIDVWEAIDAASTKPFGYLRFTPGPEWAATACPSIPATCRGRSAAAWANPSGSSSWPTTSTSTCPTMSSAA